MQTVLIIMLFAATLSGQTTGTWKLNLEKSKHSDGEPLPRNLVMRLEPHPQGEVVTIWRTTREGQSETDSYIQYHDGKDHPYPREERFDFINARRLANGTIAVIFR